MKATTKQIALFLVLAAAAAATVGGCSKQGGGNKIANEPPRVWLASAPPEGSTEKYTVHLYWGGWDPDGEVAFYQYAITDNAKSGFFDPADTTGADKWHDVFANDSVFTFTADLPVDTTNVTQQVAEFERSHTFFIRAIDGEGLASREPAYRSFTSRTLSPEVRIQVPRKNGLNPAIVPPITTFRWTAIDYVDNLLTTQDPESVSWALVSADTLGFAGTIDWLRKSPESKSAWSKWHWYKAPQDSGKFWTTNPLEFGAYIFAMRAKDEAGAITPVLDEARNVRRVRVSKRSTGPIFTVTNQYLGPVTTSTCNTPAAILDVPAGVPLQFCWTASADSYGGIVSGYRYGWDISDLNDPDQWEIDYTPFTATQACSPSRRFFFGTHTFTVEVVDNSGFCSRVEVKVNIVQFTMSKNLLLVDDYNGTAIEPGWDTAPTGLGPSDAQHDQFWETMLENLAGFSKTADMVSVTGGTGSSIPLGQVADYKSMIWNVYSDKLSDPRYLPLLYQYIQYRKKSTSGTTSGGGTKVQPNLLALFMAAGGHVFICGRHPMSNVINRPLFGNNGVRYPFMFLYELEGNQDRQPDVDNPLGDQCFAYKEMCLDVLDYSLLTYGTRRTTDLNCPVVDYRKLDGNPSHDDTMREAVPLDPNFPLLELRSEAAGPGRYYDPNVQGYDTEVYNPKYFRDSCPLVPKNLRSCFQPIYGLGCFDTTEPTYHQPIAFWSSAMADVVGEAPGAVAARSVVFGFPPVFMKPAEFQQALEYIMFEEWKLPRLQ